MHVKRTAVACLLFVISMAIFPTTNAAWAAKEPAVVTETLRKEDAEPTHAPQPYFALEPVCFSGNATYQYFDEHLAVQIQACYATGLAYFVCDIQMTDPSRFYTALSQDKVRGNTEKTSAMASRHEAVLAINGDGYTMHGTGVIIRDAEIIRAKDSNRHLLSLDSQGSLAVISDRTGEKPKTLAEQLLASGVKQTWEFGPELVRDGEKVPLPSRFYLISVRESQKEPRTAIGQIGPLHYVVIVVDGRKSGYSDGISLSGLQQIFLDAGAKTAFNLDGGGSTTLCFLGEIINRPSSGGERLVSDILYFK